MKALDLFAGTGWGVACQRLDIDEMGVEIMPEAIATREANGMRTIFYDVWDGLLDRAEVPEHEFQIASPPCQSFSMAGEGAGRRALNDVLAAMDARLYRDPRALHDLTATLDPRTALVLTPLAYAYVHRPRLIVWEQVPPVLPVWEHAAAFLRMGGYSVVTGVLHAEQYGVPQTRKRAILIARNDGFEARMPEPTHSRYYSSGKRKGTFDEGVEPYVTMATALGWGMTERPYPSIAAGTEGGGGPDHMMLGGSGARRLVSREREGGRWAYTRPATTIVGDPRLGGPGRSEYVKGGVSRQDRPGSMRLEPWEAAILQSYPEDFIWVGRKGALAQMIGNAVPPLLAEAILKEITK